jgi:predicted  nucleic acid-binding Zn-ribbon protein
MAKKVKEEVAPKTVLRSEEADLAVENRLIALYRLQQICSQIDKIRIIRGELPLEVQDLEDETEGLMTRIGKIKAEIEAAKEGIAERKIQMQECDALINRYSDQQNNVRNNREYESLAKEIEFQELEKQLCEKKIRDFNAHIDSFNAEIEKYQGIYEEKLADLEQKKSELDEIIKETEEKEQVLLEKAENNEKLIEERYLTAFKRIRSNARNGLAVVTVDRDACGGCFNKIPHQRQMDIKMHKKIIVCEYCGRILVDESIAAEVQSELEAK